MHIFDKSFDEDNFIKFHITFESFVATKATSVRDVTLTAAPLGPFLYFAQLAPIEPKNAASKVIPLAEVALMTQAIFKTI